MVHPSAKPWICKCNQHPTIRFRRPYPGTGCWLYGTTGGRRVAKVGIITSGKTCAQLHDGYSAHEEGKCQIESLSAICLLERTNGWLSAVNMVAERSQCSDIDFELIWFYGLLNDCFCIFCCNINLFHEKLKQIVMFSNWILKKKCQHYWSLCFQFHLLVFPYPVVRNKHYNYSSFHYIHDSKANAYYLLQLFIYIQCFLHQQYRYLTKIIPNA